MTGILPRPRPAITRAGRRPAADRDLVIFAASLFGCSDRLIARAFNLDARRVAQIVERVGGGAESSAPEDCPEPLHGATLRRIDPAE